MTIPEDLTEFLDTTDDGFATTSVVGTTVVPGIYETRYVEVDGFEGHAPTFLCDLAIVNAAAGGSVVHGTIVNIAVSGILHKVRGIQPDEVEVSVLLILERAT